jgi:hypothetical protein
MMGRVFANTLVRLILAAMLVSMTLIPELFAASQLRTFTNDAGLFDPSTGPLVLRYQLMQDAGRVEIRIINFRGQVANRFSFVELRAGDQTFSWDGTDNNGERVIDGRYQIIIAADLVSGGEDSIVIDTMVATVEKQTGFQLPEPLAPETYPHEIYGSASTFYRHNNERQQSNEGEVRLRTGVDYRDDSYTARGVFQVIKDWEGSAASFNGSQAMAEKHWTSGKVKGVFRDNLGSFQDPMQLFSDFRTERNKVGASFDQSFAKARLVGLVFTSEGEVDSRERGGATRLTYGDTNSLMLGASYTYRDGIENPLNDNLTTSQALAIDALYSITDTFLITAQAVATDDELLGSDYGGVIKGEYDLGIVRLSAGYVSLGENFRAEFSDPLRQVYSDAQGIDASIDYFMQQPTWYFSSLSATLRFFNLIRPSDDTTIREVDGSLRFGIGSNDSFFMSVFHRQDEFGNNGNYMANMTHSWNETWSNLIQVNYSDTDTSDSLRLTFNTNYTSREYSGRLSLEWTRRTIDYSRFSPYDQGYIRFDLDSEYYHLQLQGKYSSSQEESGFNAFGRVDYKPEFLHRYKMLAYCSLGNRASLETEEQIELGIEVQF